MQAPPCLSCVTVDMLQNFVLLQLSPLVADAYQEGYYGCLLPGGLEIVERGALQKQSIS